MVFMGQSQDETVDDSHCPTHLKMSAALASREFYQFYSKQSTLRMTWGFTQYLGFKKVSSGSAESS